MLVWPSDSRTLAREVFGRPTRVLLGAWVLGREAEAFYQGEATQALSQRGEAASAVLQELARFVHWGLLTRHEPGPSERRVWYMPQLDRPLWEVFRAASQALELLPQSAEPHGSQVGRLVPGVADGR